MTEFLVGLVAGVCVFPILSIVIYITDRIGSGDCRQGRNRCNCGDKK